MTAKVGSVREYLKELEKNKKEKPEQVKSALETYIDLWKRVIEKGLVSPEDGIDTALSKIDEKGGLYAAAE
ncbi:MAG TPA: hypothetical protein VEJ36_03245 [Nitrososphaerales archaeon]|nr:hypothetical protein [Nitrososphaerales archaeon]